MRVRRPRRSRALRNRARSKALPHLRRRQSGGWRGSSAWEIGQVPGTGPDGRISVEDVQAFVRAALASPGAAARPAAALPDFTKWGEVERKPMSGIRRKTAEHLSQAWTTIPHVTQHDKADITALEELRKQYSAAGREGRRQPDGDRVASKIVAAALKQVPAVQRVGGHRRAGDRLQEVRSTSASRSTRPRPARAGHPRRRQKNIIQLAVELGSSSEKARAGKLSLDEMQGGGFTISNLGGIGGTSFTPIVNWPEVAILGISRGMLRTGV